MSYFNLLQLFLLGAFGIVWFAAMADVGELEE